MIVVAVDAHTGELAAFDRDSGVDLVDAVTAGTAMPGLAPRTASTAPATSTVACAPRKRRPRSGYERRGALTFGGRTGHYRRQFEVCANSRRDLASQVEALCKQGSHVEVINRTPIPEPQWHEPDGSGDPHPAAVPVSPRQAGSDRVTSSDDWQVARSSSIRMCPFIAAHRDERSSDHAVVEPPQHYAYGLKRFQRAEALHSSRSVAFTGFRCLKPNPRNGEPFWNRPGRVMRQGLRYV